MDKEFKSFKVKCIYGYRCFTEGKIYEVKNGSIKTDIGWDINKFYNVDHLNRSWASKFVTYEKQRKMLSLCFIRFFIKLITIQLKLVSKFVK